MAAIETGRKLPLIGIITLIASLAVICLVWLSSTSIISSKLLDTSLKQITGQIEDIGSSYGMDAKLSYDKVDIKGFLHNRHAVIHNVRIDMADKSGLYPVKWRFATDEAVVSSDPGNSNNILVVFSKPVDFLQNEKLIKSVVFSEPLKYSFGRTNANGVLAFQHNVILPKGITVMEPKGELEGAAENAGMQAGQEEQVVFNFNKSPTVNIISSGERKINAVSYDLSDLTISKDGQTYVTIGKWVSDFNEKPTDTLGHTSGAYILEVQDIVLHGKGNGKPYNVNVNTLFAIDSAGEKLPEQKTGEEKPGEEKPDAQSAAAAGAANDIAGEGPNKNRDVVLKQFMISNPDFKISASGNFSNIKGDPLPSGEVNVDIENVQQFLASDLVTPENRPLLENVLVKITGKPLADQTQVTIPLKREKMGMFFVGKSNFEEIAAIWFSGMMMSTPPGEIPPITPGIKAPEEPVTGEPVPEEPATSLPEDTEPVNPPPASAPKP